VEPKAQAVSSAQDFRLTLEERCVLAVSATGKSAAEVANYLAHSPQAVRQSFVSAITKLGARSKLEAVVIAYRHGLIELPSN